MNEQQSQEQKRQSQSDLILSALLAGRKIDPMSALNDYGCFRLGARIYDLKQQGYDIKTEDYELPSGKRVARYSLSTERQKELFA